VICALKFARSRVDLQLEQITRREPNVFVTKRGMSVVNLSLSSWRQSGQDGRLETQALQKRLLQPRCIIGSFAGVRHTTHVRSLNLSSSPGA